MRTVEVLTTLPGDTVKANAKWIASSWTCFLLFLFDCSISKLKVSREWNTQLMKLGGDRFASLWKLSSVQTANKAGQRFMNISVSNVGWLKESAYELAKTFYENTFAKTS